MVEVLKVEDLGLGKHIGDYDIKTYNAIIIPDGATNGDMIKAMFPNVVNSNLDLVTAFNNAKYWWNEPYKGE